MHQDLAAFYENPEVPNSFGGVEALHRSVKGKYSKKDVKHWLSQKDAYTLHKPVRHKFQRNRVFVSDIDRQFQADLVDMQSLAEFNKGYKYLLTCIDLFSKFAWAVPLKDKFGKSVKSGLEIIFKERKPKVLQTDAENKISHFKTQLPSPVCLNGEWEVGLSEIIYPHSWRNVNETNNYFLYKAGDGNISSTVKRTIDVGCYETMLDIISAVQLALPKNPNRFTIIYNKATKRVKINAVQGSSLHLENLGEFFLRLLRSNFTPNCGDTQAPLLRIVRTKGKDGETISQYYDRPQYLPLVRHSFQTIQSELRLNSGDFVPFERVIQDGQWKQFHPLSNVFDNAPVEFHISGSAEDYIDLSQTQLYVKAKIVKVDNTPITKDDTIGPVNLFLHSLFSQVDVSLNDRVVSNSSNTYPYRSYIETLLNHGYDSKTSQLTAELFYKDSDDGLKKRTEFLKKVQL
ncbi:integrase catalytic domain-containing protein [Trichonephila clavipes]|nr:integrase catalytic domain-containing protein [Trichonephila clavipes]